jgi:hypothetical protein
MSGDGDTQVTQAMIIPMDGGGGPITLQWNPKLVAVNKTIRWQHLRVAGREQPFQQYGCGEPRMYTIHFELSASNRGKGYVKETVDSIMELTKPTVGGTVKRPPKCMLIMGSFINLTCIVHSVKVRHNEFFDPMGLNSTFADVVIDFEEYLEDEGQ